MVRQSKSQRKKQELSNALYEVSMHERTFQRLKKMNKRKSSKELRKQLRKNNDDRERSQRKLKKLIADIK